VIEWQRVMFGCLFVLSCLFIMAGTAGAAINDDGFTLCAAEGGTCPPAPSGPHWFRFGSGDSFVTYTAPSSSIPCRDVVETGLSTGFGGPYRTATPRSCYAKPAVGLAAPPGGLGYVRTSNTTLYWPVCAGNVACTSIDGMGGGDTDPGDVGLALIEEPTLLRTQVATNFLAVAAVLGILFAGYATGSRR